MSRVDHWRNHKLCKGNRMKSGALGNTRHKFHKISDRYLAKDISQYNNKRKMLDKPMLRRVHLVRVHMQYRKKILNDMEVKNHEN